jgi:hypothetical protein
MNIKKLIVIPAIAIAAGTDLAACGGSSADRHPELEASSFEEAHLS